MTPWDWPGLWRKLVSKVWDLSGVGAHSEPASGSQRLTAGLSAYAIAGNPETGRHLDQTDPGRDYVSQRPPREQVHLYTRLWNPGPPGKVACKVSGLGLGSLTRFLSCVPERVSGLCELVGLGRSVGFHLYDCDLV